MWSGEAPLVSASAFVSASIIFGTDSSLTRVSNSLTSIQGTAISSFGGWTRRLYRRFRVDRPGIRPFVAEVVETKIPARLDHARGHQFELIERTG
jgi:hypothetical protein